MRIPPVKQANLPTAPLGFLFMAPKSWTPKVGYGEGGLSLITPSARLIKGLSLAFSWAYLGIAPPPKPP